MLNMEYRRLHITIISASGLRNVNLIFKMDVYVVVSIVGYDRKTNCMTHIHRRGGTTPKWNHRMTFSVAEADLASPTHLSLLFQLRSQRLLGNRDIGFVSVPFQELLSGDTSFERVADYQVRKPSGKFKGRLKFSYKFVTAPEKIHDPFTAYPPHVGAGTAGAPPPLAAVPYPPPPAPEKVHEPVTAYAPHLGAPVTASLPPPVVAVPNPPPPAYAYPPRPQEAA